MKKMNGRLWKGFSGSWFSSFFSNLLSVIIGITITFGISFLIEQRKEKAQMREMVDLVQKELITNKEWFERQDSLIAHHISIYKILLDNEESHWKNIPFDSLCLLIDDARTINFSYNSTNSWDLFRSSEIFQKFPNKDLLNLLSQGYFLTETIQREIVESYYKDIRESTEDIYGSYRDNPYTYMGSFMKTKKAKRFLQEDIAAKDMFHNNFITICAWIDMTLDVIKNSGHNFRKPLDKDYEFEPEFEKYLDKYKKEKEE
jgi:hypothetical protein